MDISGSYRGVPRCGLYRIHLAMGNSESSHWAPSRHFGLIYFLPRICRPSVRTGFSQQNSIRGGVSRFALDTVLWKAVRRVSGLASMVRLLSGIFQSTVTEPSGSDTLTLTRHVEIVSANSERSPGGRSGCSSRVSKLSRTSPTTSQEISTASVLLQSRRFESASIVFSGRETPELA